MKTTTGPAAPPVGGDPSTLPPARPDPAMGEPIKPELKWGVVVGTVLIPLVGIIMGIIFMVDANASPEKKEVGKLWLMVGIGAIVLQTICWCGVGALAGGGY